MRISRFAFGALEIDGVTYEHDVVIDRGEIQKRKKKASTRPSRFSRALTFTIANGKITEIEVIGNPARLGELDVSIVG